ncbi:hypothetical protein [Asticcacaulis tiandongensis]|uniref:hypothetical protein n=1 Tax=Asticcacaulis tiandongensis TaxID=2565365 RepID=UPI00112A6A09|nr:hypothetical protein [Asticcacaulis tiandongensis]
MAFPPLKLSPAFLLTAFGLLTACGLLTLAGCGPSGAQADKDTPYLATSMGYSRTPEITHIVINPEGELQVSGIAVPQGRVRLVAADGRAIGVTADAQGRFTAEVPQGPGGSLYTLLMESGGRLIQAEGTVFVPAQSAATDDPGAVFLREGAATLPMSARSGLLAALDYDAGGGMAVSGRSLPDIVIEVLVDGQTAARTRTDATGLYHALIPPANRSIGSRFQLSVRGANNTENRMVTLKAPQANRIEAEDGQWYVHRGLSGGGAQTTVVF